MIIKSESLMNTDNDSSASKNEHRRIEDNIEDMHTYQSMNLERRIKYNERRSKAVSHYMGPSRRFNIDRRMSNAERRE